MIPSPGCDPKINILVIGAALINSLKDGPIEEAQLIQRCAINNSVSIDHVILSLDWLHIISAIETENGMVKINASN